MKNTFILFCLIFISCENKARHKEIPPANILDEEKFKNVLVDFALAESAANMNVKNSVAPKLDSVYAFNPLKENNVRLEQYDSTLDWYSHHTEEYKKVYEKVLDRLTEIKANKKLLTSPDTSRKN